MMEKMPLITVVTAVYCPVSAGRTDVFREMMASVAELGKYCSVEHWIQDGGSQDGSMDLYQEYRGQIHLESAPDGGIYDAMNKASFAASGKYLVFLNSDDFYHDPRALAELVAELEETGADYAFAPVRRIRSNGKEEVRPVKLYSIFGRMPYCHQALIVKKSCFEEMGGYDTAFRILGDYDFALRLYLGKKSFVCGKKAFATFRSGGVSHDKTRNHQERAAIFRKIYGKWYSASDEEFLKIASNKAFPWTLFKKLLPYARTEDRIQMLWWYFCRIFR